MNYKYLIIFIIRFLFFCTSYCIAQNSGYYVDFKTAFKYPDSVKVISIDCMHSNELQTDGCKELPENIDVFQNLTELYLSETHIKKIPENITKLKNLKTIILHGNISLDYKNELSKLLKLDSLIYLGLPDSYLNIHYR